EAYDRCESARRTSSASSSTPSALSNGAGTDLRELELREFFPPTTQPPIKPAGRPDDRRTDRRTGKPRAAASADGRSGSRTAPTTAPPPSTANDGDGCWPGTSCAWGRPRLTLLLGPAEPLTQRGPARINGLMCVIRRKFGPLDTAPGTEPGTVR